MHSEDQRPNDLIYGLDDRPRPLPAFLAALQHVLASFVGIVTPPLVIGSLRSARCSASASTCRT